MNAHSWVHYVNPGTVFVSLGIWAALTSVRVPAKSSIETDSDYNLAVEHTKLLLLLFASFGFMLFGALSLGDAFIRRSADIAAALSEHVQSFFVVSAVVYALTTVVYVTINRNKIESLYRG